MNARQHSPLKQVRAFTLIEVIVTLSVFILLSASVFSIMTAVFQSSNLLKENQNRRDEVSALQAFLKSRLENLAATDQIATYQRGDGDGLRVTGLLMMTQGETEAVDATKQSNGLYALRLAQPPPPTPDEVAAKISVAQAVASFTQKLEKNVDALTWTPLIRDVRTITWQFQTPPSPDWMPAWNSPSTKPALVECSMQLAGDEIPTVMDFSIPNVAASPSQQPVLATNHAP